MDKKLLTEDLPQTVEVKADNIKIRNDIEKEDDSEEKRENSESKKGKKEEKKLLLENVYFGRCSYFNGR